MRVVRPGDGLPSNLSSLVSMPLTVAAKGCWRYTPSIFTFRVKLLAESQADFEASSSTQISFSGGNLGRADHVRIVCRFIISVETDTYRCLDVKSNDFVLSQWGTHRTHRFVAAKRDVTIMLSHLLGALPSSVLARQSNHQQSTL